MKPKFSYCALTPEGDHHHIATPRYAQGGEDFRYSAVATGGVCLLDITPCVDCRAGTCRYHHIAAHILELPGWGSR